MKDYNSVYLHYSDGNNEFSTFNEPKTGEQMRHFDSVFFVFTSKHKTQVIHTIK